MEKFVNCFFELLDDTDKSLITSDTVFKELEEWTSIGLIFDSNGR